MSSGTPVLTREGLRPGLSGSSLCGKHRAGAGLQAAPHPTEITGGELVCNCYKEKKKRKLKILL